MLRDYPIRNEMGQVRLSAADERWVTDANARYNRQTVVVLDIRGGKTEPAMLRQAAVEATKEHSMTSGTSAFLRGTLNDELDWFRARCKQEWPPEALDLVNQTLAELADTGIHSRALKAGDTAPVFTLPDQAGALVHSQDLLSRGPLVVNFYRGMW